MAHEAIRGDVILAEMRTGLTSILREMEAMKTEQRRMHEENADRHDQTNDRLDKANDRLNQINGKVQRHDGLIEGLRADMTTVRMKIHDINNNVQRFISDALNSVHRTLAGIAGEEEGRAPKATVTMTTKTEASTGENRQITMRDFYIATGALVAGWAMKALLP